MSAGLMSCVRQNSPPLEMGGGGTTTSSAAITATGADSLPPDTPETQKRRRFHPLRNLRRIFRRRTVAQADNLSTRSNSVIDETLLTSYNHHGGSHGRLHIRSPDMDIDPMPFTSTLSSSSSSTVPTSLSNNSYHKSHHHHHHLLYNTTTNAGKYLQQSGTKMQQQPQPSSHPISGSVSASGGFYLLKEKREHSADSAKTNTEAASDLEDRDMTDYQRSLSEGRLVDSELGGDARSQSHDSVFSESATASSLSIVLKAELADALRKRRNRPIDASDEDLGLPRSPTTPQREKSTINQSEGSLSLLSMASSEMEDESASSIVGNTSTGAGYSQNTSFASNKSSLDTSGGSCAATDDLDSSVKSSGSSRLSHSAARHKMAVRPKKKGPTRYRIPSDSNALPSTPEVNEESQRISILETLGSQSIKIKSQSLPPGMNAKMIEKQEFVSQKEDTATSSKTITKTSTTLVESHISSSITSKTSMYVNRILSKSSDFEKQEPIEPTSPTTTLERKDEEGFFKRFILRSSNKKKKSKDDMDGGGTLEKEKPNDNTLTRSTQINAEHKPEDHVDAKPVPLNTYLPNAELPKTSSSTLDKIKPIVKHEKPRSGPASRQRVLPQDISVSPIPAAASAPSTTATAEKPPPKSPNKLSLIDGGNQFGYSPKPTNKVVFNGLVTGGDSDEKVTATTAPSISRDSKYIKANQQHRSDDQLVATRFKKFSSDDISSSSMNRWSDDKIGRTSRVATILSHMDAQMDQQQQQQLPRRKAVEKSKSFRFYTENASNNTDNLQNSTNMPSLPDLSFNVRNNQQTQSVYLSSRFAPRSQASVSSTSIRSSLIVPDDGASAGGSSSTSSQFEINDNNLIKPKEDPHPNLYTENIILATPKPTTIVSNSNITQIEDNIDKIMKSSFVTVLKKASPSDALDNKSKNISVTSILSSDTPPSSLPIPPRKPEIITTKLPEFMKIQLNRVDSSVNRPKSHIVLSKNPKEGEIKERRFSNESVEITDSNPTKDSNIKLNHPNKSSESISNSSSSSQSPLHHKLTDRFSSGSISSMTDSNNTADLVERRKSVSDEKLKFEKKIEEMKAVGGERKRSVTAEDIKPQSRKSSLEDANAVVLRKKSLSQSNNSNTSSAGPDEPELMKVFARRSLKIKDTDEYQVYDESEKVALTKAMKSLPHMDSDKENQSSSEEKLDKIPKADVIVMPPPSKVSVAQPTQQTSVEDNKKPSLIAPKSYKPVANRFGNLANVRMSTSSVVENRKTITTSASTESNGVVRHTMNVTTNIAPTSMDSGPKPTESAVSCSGRVANADGKSEFKGILQRRAEWEKRASESFK